MAQMTPAQKAKIKTMFPKVTKAEVAKQALVNPKKPMAPRTPSKGVKKPMPKIQGAKPGVKKPMPKLLTGPAAVKAMQDRVSPAGVKKAEAGAKKAIDKKYPGLYKKSK
jgi:hypothetical protein